MSRGYRHAPGGVPSRDDLTRASASLLDILPWATCAASLEHIDVASNAVCALGDLPDALADGLLPALAILDLANNEVRVLARARARVIAKGRHD